MQERVFTFSLNRVEEVLIFFNLLLQQEMGEELGEAEASMIRYEGAYPLILPHNDLQVNFSHVPDTKEVTATVRGQDKDCFETAAAILLFVTCFSPEKELYGMPEFLQAIFVDVPYPGNEPGQLLSCSPEHLSICEECQEVYSNFVQKDWRDVVQGWEVPVGFADIAFLSPSAQLYFFPAYILASVKYGEKDLLERARGSLRSSNVVLTKSQESACRLASAGMNNMR